MRAMLKAWWASAVLALRGGEVAIGTDAIRRFYAGLLSTRPAFQPGDQRPALVHGGLALTSTRLKDGTVTAEVARRQPDGSWRWILDQPAIAVENEASSA